MRRLLALVLAACVPDAPPDRVLVYTRTLGYRHADVIALGATRLASWFAGSALVDTTEDPATFRTENLARYRAVVFLYTSGNDILDDAGKVAFEAYVRGGGGWLGLHSAADTEYAWPFYQQLVVTPFRVHPSVQPARVHVEAREHPAMRGVPSEWDATDEWYDFTGNARDTAGVTVLATLEEASYSGGSTGADHPLIWAHEDLGGRALYAAPGHVAARWDEPGFRALVESSLRWVMKRD